MTTIKLTKFGGEAPRMAEELLPDSAAAYSLNCKLYSGDLIPYPKAVEAEVLTIADVQTIYPMWSDAYERFWLQWATDVDVAESLLADNSSKRVYYTGDGAPKQTDFALATTGVGAYPIAYRPLGVPAPTQLVEFAPEMAYLETTFRQRSSGAATLTVASSLTLLSGDVVTTHMVGGSGYNILDVPLTGVSPTTISYTNAEPDEAITADTGRIYFNAEVGSAQRARLNNIATITLTCVPAFSVGATITTKGFGGTDYNVVNTEVTAISGNNVSYVCVGADEVTTVDVNGTIEMGGTSFMRSYVVTFVTDWAEESAPSVAPDAELVYDGQHVILRNLPTIAPTGYSGIVTHKKIYRSVHSVSGEYYALVDKIAIADDTYIDTYMDVELGDAMVSQDYDLPDANMQGLVRMANGILAGFFGNQVCFCEPYKPWAWPIKYRRTMAAEVVGLCPLATALVVCTKQNPVLINGTSPAVMTDTRLDAKYPCSSKRSIANTGQGAMYSTPDGLALLSTGGNAIATRMVHYRDTWQGQVPPNTLLGEYYNGKYFGAHGNGAFVFDSMEAQGGVFTQVGASARCLRYDYTDGYLYYVSTDNPQQVLRWDDLGGDVGEYQWWSKRFRLAQYANFGAARVLAEYPTAASAMSDEVYDGLLGGSYITGRVLADDDEAEAYEAVDFVPVLTFELWTDGRLRYTKTVEDNQIFRLPRGYMSDNVQIRLTSNLRIKEVHLGETPYGLRGI